MFEVFEGTQHSQFNQSTDSLSKLEAHNYLNKWMREEVV